MRIMILGCGPSGLIAAHAVEMRGHQPLIYSKPRKSHMNGAQYLHAPIPVASKQKPFLIDYQVSGSIDGYRDKVYGSGSAVQVSPETLVGRHLAWDIRDTYDWLWDQYGHMVMGFEAGEHDAIKRLVGFGQPDAVISTIPAKLLCQEEHWFGSTKVWASDYSEVALSDNTVLCQGEPKFPWYRASRIQGYENTEWPLHRKPDVGDHGLWLVEKPTTTTCRCFPEIVRMGRYGQWKKGVLSHQAWEDTNKLIDKLEGITHAPTDS